MAAQQQGGMLLNVSVIASHHGCMAAWRHGGMAAW
jgi:hypothetical protein